MADIFLSYNREDQASARRFAEAFASEGFEVWWDATLRSGQTYDEVTETALRTAKAVVVLWSPRSVASRWVRAEATLADRNRTLIPVMIEDCERPIMFELTQTADLIGWRGDLAAPDWRGLIADVRRHLESHATSSEAGPTPKPTPTPTAPPAQPGQRGGAPTLAVLPFANRSGEAEDEVFAFGMVEDLIDAMSQGLDVQVVSSSAVARFRRGSSPDLDGLGRELGVRYVLEGNVRRAGPNLRVTAQLVEIQSGAVLWSQKFERPLERLALLQEDLVLEVAGHLRSQARKVEIARALRKPGDLTAWEAVMRCISAMRRVTGPALVQALQEARRAVEIAPDYGLALAYLSVTEATVYYSMSPDDPVEAQRIRALADKATQLEPDSAMVTAAVAHALISLGLPQEGLAVAQRSIELNPHNELGQMACGRACALLDRGDEALAYFDREQEVAPDHPATLASLIWRATVHARAERWAQALGVYDAVLKLAPDEAGALVGRCMICAQMGAADEARACLVRARLIDPETPLALWRLRFERGYVGSHVQGPLLDHLDTVWAATAAPAE